MYYFKNKNYFIKLKNFFKLLKFSQKKSHLSSEKKIKRSTQEYDDYNNKEIEYIGYDYENSNDDSQFPRDFFTLKQRQQGAGEYFLLFLYIIKLKIYF